MSETATTQQTEKPAHITMRRMHENDPVLAFLMFGVFAYVALLLWFASRDD